MDNDTKLPSDIASIVFSEQPATPKSYQLYCESDTEQPMDTVDIFEIFLTILMEGIFIKHQVTSDTLNMFDENAIICLRPWLLSLGYDVAVDKCGFDQVDVYDQYYCKIILRDDPSWVQYFEMHDKITKRYHFIFGGNSPHMRREKCTLSNMYAIIVSNNVYKISFRCI